jgi:multidrug resistance efflux pump
MDMTLTALTQELMSLSRLLSDAQNRLARAEDDAARTRHRFDHAHARAFLTAEGSVDARKAQAALDTEQHSLDAEVAEAAVRTARQEMRTITTRIEVGRSLVSSARAEMTNFVGAS